MMEKIQTTISRQVYRFAWRDYLLLTVSALISAINVNLFMAPADIAPGGVTGMAILVNHYTDWPIGLTMLVLNIPLVMLGFKYLGRFRFLTRVLYVVLLYNLGVDFLAPFLPNGITDDLLLNALFASILGGVGTGLTYRGRASSAGTGILGRILQLKTGMPVSQLYIFTDGGVIAVMGLVFGWDRALYSLLTLFVWGFMVDYVLEGPSVVRTVFIITDKPDQITSTLLSRLKIGITAWTGQGMYTKENHTVLFCTVSRPDVNYLKNEIIAIDPYAFVVIGQGHQATGGIVRPPKKRADLSNQKSESG